MSKGLDLNWRSEALSCEILRALDDSLLDGSGRLERSGMLWNISASLARFMAEGTLFECNPDALDAGYDAMLAIIRHSLKVEEWRLKGPPPWPNAWIKPNLALVDHRWWQDGVIDRMQLEAIFNKGEPWIHGSILVGIDQAERLLSIGAYHLIEPMQKTVNSNSAFPRAFESSDRLGLLLAKDPGQLHDPKSSVRKSARSIMKRKMEGWISESGGWMPFHWLRTFEWREGEGGLSPRETMLRAYAYMPHVDPPARIAREVEQLRKIPI